MSKEVVPGVQRVIAGGTGVYLLDHDGLTIIDTGLPGNVEKIWEGVASIGWSPTDVKNVILTHYHQDHIGGLEAVLAETDATVYAPKGDSALIRSGGPQPPLEHRGFIGGILTRFIRPSEMPPNRVDVLISGGDRLEIAGGLRVIDTPGHTGGHVSLLWPQQGGVLFVGDAAFNLLGRVGPPPVAEDFPATDASFKSLGELDFEVAVFGHGPPSTSRAAARFRAAGRKLG